MRYVIEIPGWRPALDNELFAVHYMLRYRRKRKDAEVLWRAALVHGVPRAKGPRSLKVEIRGRYHRGAIPDDPAPFKSLLDGLVAAGVLVDDSREWLTLDWPPTFTNGTKGTTLTLEDLP